MMENAQLVHCLERDGNGVGNTRFHGRVNTVKDRLSSPAEEHEVHINAAVIIVWPDQTNNAQAYGDILPLDGLESVIHIILVLQAGKIYALHALGN